MPTTPTERLDVEDDGERELRLRHLLQRTNSTASPSNNNAPFTPPDPSSFDFGVRETHALGPPTQLLDRLEQFLPQMEAANADLQHRMQADAESVDIEDLGDAEEGQYIEMNLGLGVFDVRRPVSEDTGTSSSSSSDDSDSSDDDASDSELSGTDSDASTSVIGGIRPSSEGNFGLSSRASNSSSAQRPIKPLPKRSRPNIIVLGESNAAQLPPDNAEQ